MGTAAAFAPAKQGQTSTALNFDLTEGGMLGAQPPLGVWDPLGMIDGDEEKFDRLRYVELKHGRICMLGFLGQITTRAGIYLPGDIDQSGDAFSSFPNGIAAVIGPDAIPSAGALQIFAFVGALELGVMKDITGGEFVGDFRNDSLDFGWDTFDEETKLSKRAIELNNGRAAMMGLLGLMVHEKLNEAGTVADLPIIGVLA